jgi:hypothetical protein
MLSFRPTVLYLSKRNNDDNNDVNDNVTIIIFACIS